MTVIKPPPHFILGAFVLTLTVWGNSASGACTGNVPEYSPEYRYIDHADGTVTDRETGLMWAKCSGGLSGNQCELGTPSTVTWMGAVFAAKIQNIAGYADWRLPNIKELASLVNRACAYPSINSIAFPNSEHEAYWSSTLHSASKAYLVHFGTGLDLSHERSGRYLMRVVRDNGH